MRDKLSKITIRGYKSIAYDHPVELRLQDVTLLLGANGSGKSNILSFFKMLGFMMTGSLQLYVEQEGTSNTLLHYGVKKTPRLA
ncbi:MAG: chromosome segregation protein SMC, partial [Alloprevotella sp.]